MQRFAHVIGEVLRTARRRRGLTLREVWRTSGGEFKPSALGGYERGERSISLDKFCTLSEIYGVPADTLLGEALKELNPERRRKVVVDLNALAALRVEGAPQSDVARALGRFVHAIRSRRGDFLTNVVSLRSGDLEGVALELGISPRTIIRRLEGVVRDRKDVEPPDVDGRPSSDMRVLSP